MFFIFLNTLLPYVYLSRGIFLIFPYIPYCIINLAVRTRNIAMFRTSLVVARSTQNEHSTRKNECSTHTSDRTIFLSLEFGCFFFSAPINAAPAIVSMILKNFFALHGAARRSSTFFARSWFFEYGKFALPLYRQKIFFRAVSVLSIVFIWK